MIFPTSFNIEIASGTLLEHGSPLNGQVKIQGEYVGIYEDRIEHTFEEEKSQHLFFITRLVKATVGSKADHTLLKPQAPFLPRTETIREPEITVLPAERPPVLNAIKYTARMPLYQIPKALIEILSSGSRSKVVERIQKHRPPKLRDGSNYSHNFGTLVWAEEYQMEYVYFENVVGGHNFSTSIIDRISKCTTWTTQLYFSPNHITS